jgi:hypothetical protein
LRDKIVQTKNVAGIPIKTYRFIEMPSGYGAPFGDELGRGKGVTATSPQASLLYEVDLEKTSNTQMSDGEFEISTKSFISRMADTSDGPTTDVTKRALGFQDLTGGRTDALALLFLTDKTFSEAPISPDPAKMDFRLWSSVKLSATCAGGAVASWKLGELQTAFGKETVLPAVGKIDYGPFTFVRLDPLTGISQVLFSYRISGRPNALTLPTFNLVRPRSCSWIWHEVIGSLTCEGKRARLSTAVRGSSFPSHRTWVSNNLVADLPQGPFEHLWYCEKSDDSRVR